MIILDASVLIGHFESADVYHADATALLTAHALESFAANVITLAEVYVGAARAGRADQLHQLLARLQIDSLDLPAGAARRLGQLRALQRGGAQRRYCHLPRQTRGSSSRSGVDCRDQPTVARQATTQLISAKQIASVINDG